jgi:hypothetical protein
VRHQDGAEIPCREGPSRALPHHHLRRRLPRPDAGDHRRWRPAKYIDGFGPKVDGFDQVPFDDEKALRAAITPETAALMIEPIQGEGGLRSVPARFLKLLRELCDEQGLMLIFDEIQTGVGRTGKFFAHEMYGVAPDIMSIAKGIGGGFPMGACLATEEAASGMTLGTHGTTFGGNPLAWLSAMPCSTWCWRPASSKRRPDRSSAEAVARRAQGQAPGRHRRDPRRGPDARPQAAHRTPSSSPRRAPMACSSSAPATMSCACCRR